MQYKIMTLDTRSFNRVHGKCGEQQHVLAIVAAGRGHGLALRHDDPFEYGRDPAAVPARMSSQVCYISLCVKSGLVSLFGLPFVATDTPPFVSGSISRFSPLPSRARRRATAIRITSAFRAPPTPCRPSAATTRVSTVIPLNVYNGEKIRAGIAFLTQCT